MLETRPCDSPFPQSGKPDISNSVGPVKIFLSALLRSTPLSVFFIRFVARRIDDHGSFGNLSVGFSPTQTSLRSELDHDCFFQLPFPGAGRPFKCTGV